MAFQQTPLALPLVVATGTSVIVVVLAWRKRDHPGGTSLAVLMGAAAWWAGVYAISMAQTDLADKLLAHNVMYVAVVVVPVAWLVFTLDYTGQLRLLSRRRLAGLLVIPGVTLGLLWTNGAHGLMWAEITVSSQGQVLVLDKEFGPWFWVFASYSYLLLFVGAGLLTERVLREDFVYRGQALALVGAVLVPWGANALFLAGLLGPINPTAIGFVITGTLMMGAIYRQHLLEVVPITREVARDQLIDSMGEAAIVVDTNGTVVDLNPAARDYLVDGIETAIGRSHREVFPALGDLVSAYSGDGASRAEMALAVGGDRRYIDVQISPFTRASGTTAGVLVTLRDVTGRVRREEQLIRHRGRLEVLNRVLRHDLRNAMSIVLGNVEELIERADDDEAPLARAIKEKSEEIVALSEKASRLERSFADEEAAVVRIDVSALLESVVDRLETVHPDAEIELECPPGLRVMASEMIESAIKNVLENAVIHNDQANPSVTITVTADDGAGEIRIEIADDGPGLPPVERSVIESRSETPVEHSVGLGLWLVYWIVTSSGGSVEAADNDPRGTVVTICLPAAGAEPEAIPQQADDYLQSENEMNGFHATSHRNPSGSAK